MDNIHGFNEESVTDYGDYVEVSVGYASLVNRSGQHIVEADHKIAGEKWRVHKTDADPYPSNPHAHCVSGSKRLVGCTLHLGTAELYRKRNALGRFLEHTQFERLLNLIQPKFPHIKFPLDS